MSPATSLGFSAVEFAEDVLGMRLFPWQRWLLIHALELLADGRFRFRTVLVLVARQNGKTTLVEVKNLWKMFVLRTPLVINTAQNLDVSEESWDKAVEIVESIPDLAAEMDGDPTRVNGKKTLRLIGGSRWKVATASRKGGRGLSGDDVNLDELREHQTWDSWGAVTKTTLARRKAQIWAYSNAGDDKSVVLNDLHAKGLETVEAADDADPSLGLFEWSAPPGCDTADESNWPMASPSLGYEGGVQVEALRSALRTDPEPVFRTECLCQRVSTMEPQPIDAKAFMSLAADRQGPPSESPRFFPDVSPGMVSASIGVAYTSADGRPRLELADPEQLSGTDWLVARCAELAQRYPEAAWAVDGQGAIGSFLPQLAEVGIEPEKFSAGEMGRAHVHLERLVADRGLSHDGDEAYARAMSGAVKRDLGDGLWVYVRRKSSTILSPLVAVTGAAWLLESVPEESSAAYW